MKGSSAYPKPGMHNKRMKQTVSSLIIIFSPEKGDDLKALSHHRTN
jgi:hypothetical protein